MKLSENPAKAAHIAAKKKLRARIWRLKLCDFCPKEFDPVESGHRDYCSDDCCERSEEALKNAQRDADKDKYHADKASKATKDKICICGKKFFPLDGRQKYHNERCRWKFQKKEQRKVVRHGS